MSRPTHRGGAALVPQTTSIQVEFPFDGARRVRAVFDAQPISSDGGLPLLREADRRVGLVDALARCLPAWRDPDRVEHQDVELLRQRIFQIGLGYEDCNDAEALRGDPVLKTCCGRDPQSNADLASQPTLSRFENAMGPKTAYLLGRAMLESYVARHPKRPRRIVLDLDTTDDPTHGQQELQFYNAHYGEHMYMPLLVFDEHRDLIAAVLQPGNQRGGTLAVALLKRIIARLRRKWRGIPILVRADSAFAVPALYALCEQENVDFLLGFPSNTKLKKMTEALAEKARRRFLRTGSKARVFKAIRYRARGGNRPNRWPKAYRVVIKAEHMAEGPNRRYVITTLTGRPEDLYQRYVERGGPCENSIKDLKRALHADRLSCHRFWANQFRLAMHAAGYVLMHTLRLAAHGTQLATAQMDTLRLRLLKVGAQVTSSARRIWIHLASSYPYRALWLLVARRLLTGPPAR
jgi:hypothetical protein